MGRKPRIKPRRLGQKMRRIREALGISQNEMLRRMGLDEEYGRNNLSNYELSKREPPLSIVVGYARLAGISVDLMVDDKLDLPKDFLKADRRPPTSSKARKK